MRFGFIIAWHLPGGTLCDRSKRPDGSATGAAAIYATSVVVSSIGSTIEGSSFSGLFTRVEIGHIRISSAGKPHQVARIRLLAEPARVVARSQNERHAVMDLCD
jgi:hypothetical protein